MPILVQKEPYRVLVILQPKQKVSKTEHSNGIGLYRRIWLVTILCKILNLPVVTKGFSWKDPPSWKHEILHVTFTIHKNKISTLQTYFSLNLYQNWSVHDAKKRLIFTF